jgi:hypothetical protein
LAYRVDYAKGEFQGFGFAGVHGKAHNFRTDAADDGSAASNSVTGEAFSTKDTRIDLFEADAYFIRGDLTAQAQVSVGRQRKAAITADADTGELRDAYWSGLSGLIAYKFQPRLEGVLRVDHIFNKKNGGGLLTYTSQDTSNGIGYAKVLDDTGSWVDGNTNKGVDRTAISLGLNYALNANTLLKAEYRLDRASGAIFEDSKDGSYKKSNQLIGTSVVVSF